MLKNTVHRRWFQLALLGGAVGLLLGLQQQAKARSAQAQVVDYVEQQRLLGRWYEIARLPNLFQSADQVGGTDTYSAREDGKMDVVYRYHPNSFDQPARELKAVLWREPTAVPRGAFKFQAFWPFVADYWIIDLGPDYDYLVVGSPQRDMLWIMARTPSLSPELYQQIVQRAADLGYPVQRLLRVPQPLSPEQAQAISP